MARADNDLTPAQWGALRAAWSGCAYCGAQDVPLQRDCVLPLSRGGRYTLENVVPACRSCNASKCHQEVTHWLRVKRLDEAAFLLRHRAIAADLVRAEPRGGGSEPDPDLEPEPGSEAAGQGHDEAVHPLAPVPDDEAPGGEVHIP